MGNISFIKAIINGIFLSLSFVFISKLKTSRSEQEKNVRNYTFIYRLDSTIQ